MNSLNILKNKYPYCVINQIENDSNLEEKCLNNKSEEVNYAIETDTDIKLNLKNKNNKQDNLDVKIMILYSLPSFGKMSSLVMLK